MLMHYVNVGFFPVAANGQVILRSAKTTTIGDMISSVGSEHRVIPSADVPNSAGYPTVKAYLALEAAGGYVLNHMDQTTIITYLT